MSHFITICIFTRFILQSLGEPSIFWQHKLRNFSNIVPDVLDEIPEDFEKCRVVYPSGAEVNLGNYLTLNETIAQPDVTWSANQSSYYLLVFEDPDTPNPHRFIMRECVRWMVVNIPGNNVSAGETVLEYTYPFGSHLWVHRNIFLIYQQPEKQNYCNEMVQWRAQPYGRNIRQLARKYNLQGPVAINFFLHRTYE